MKNLFLQKKVWIVFLILLGLAAADVVFGFSYSLARGDFVLLLAIKFVFVVILLFFGFQLMRARRKERKG